MPFPLFAFWSAEERFSVGASPSSIYNFIIWRGGPRPAVVSSPAICTVAAGLPPYSFLWQRESGPSEITASSPENPETTFRADTAWPQFNFTGVFRCRVTDSLGTILFTNPVTVLLERYYDP